MLNFTIAEYRISNDIQFKIGEMVTVSYRNRDGEVRQLTGNISSIETDSPLPEFDTDLLIFAKVEIDGEEKEIHYATLGKPNQVIYFACEEEPEAESNLDLFKEPPTFTTPSTEELVAFELKDGTKIIEFNTNGDIFVKGKKIEVNEELAEALKIWLRHHGYPKGDE